MIYKHILLSTFFLQPPSLLWKWLISFLLYVEESAQTWIDKSLSCLSKKKAAVQKKVLWFIARLLSVLCLIQAEIIFHCVEDKIRGDFFRTSLISAGLFFVAGVRVGQPWIQTSRGLEKVSHLSRHELMCLHPSLWSFQPAYFYCQEIIHCFSI